MLLPPHMVLWLWYYGHVAMDCPDKIPPSGTSACHRTNTNDRHDRSSSRHHSHTRCSHHDYKDRSRLSCYWSCSCNHRYRSSSCQDSIEVTPGHSTDLPNVVSHITGAQVPTATAMTHCTTDLHLIGILPEMTADLNINPKNNTTDQPTDPHPPHKHHLGNIRIRDTSNSPLMTHH